MGVVQLHENDAGSDGMQVLSTGHGLSVQFWAKAAGSSTSTSNIITRARPKEEERETVRCTKEQEQEKKKKKKWRSLPSRNDFGD